MRPLVLTLLTLLLPAATPLAAALAYPPKFDGARAEVYKTIGDVKLSLHIFEPAAGAKLNRPAIVFFFGGGWNSGSPAQFEQQCRHLASRGMVAIIWPGLYVSSASHEGFVRFAA